MTRVPGLLVMHADLAAALLRAAERLNQHLIEVMKRKSAAKAWVREDTE